MCKLNQLVKEYLAATYNEIHNENLQRYRYNEKLPYIPRVSKWISLWLENKKIINIIYYLSLLLWLCGGYVFFVFFDLVKIGISKNKGFKKNNKIHKDMTYLAISLDSIEIMQNCKFFDATTVNIFVVPWCDVNRDELSKSNYLYMTDYLSFNDYLNAFFYSIVSFIYCIINSNTRLWSLQMYTAPKWFLVRIALGKLESNFVTTEHFDRWATLVDRVCMEKNKKLILIQHGSLKAIMRPEYSHFSIYSRLHSVSSLICYDELEAKIFKEKILRIKKNSPIREFYTGLGLKITKTFSDKYSVFFIGHPQCESTQSRILCELRKIFGNSIHVFYKEHPKAKASMNVKCLDWEIIKNSDFYPDVDLAISYASTLGYQYEEVGIKVFFHDLSDNSDLISNNIIQYIKAILKND